MSKLLERMRQQQAERLAALKAPAQATVADAQKANAASTSSVSSAQAPAVNDSIVRARQLLNSAEEQMAKDQASGLFDIAIPEGTDIPVEKFKIVFQKLRLAQIAKTPDLPNLQIETMENLRQYEELCHILRDEQVAVIVSGAFHVANVKIATGKSKTATATTAAKASGLSLGDLGL